MSDILHQSWRLVVIMAYSTEVALYWACKQGDKGQVRTLLGEQVNPWSSAAIGSSGDTPLHWACRYGWLDIVKAILDKKACTNQESSLGGLVFAPIQALSGAVYSYFGSTGDVETMDGSNQTPIFYACRGGHLDVV